MEQLIAALKRDCRHFGPTLARTAYERGLAVTDKDGNTRPIPITATPVVIERAELDRRAKLSAHLSSAGAKMARAVLAGARREMLLSALSPLERRVAERTFERATTLATTRVDYFVSDRPYALELNATIPAMQGYSDIAAQSFIEIVGRFWGLKDHVIARLWAQNRPNALPLYRALLAGYARVRPGRSPERIALLCRRNDAQITELGYLCERFREWGTDADVVHPDQLSGDDAVRANGKTYDLVYRHLFVRRLEEPELANASYCEALFTEEPGRRAVVLNPPASQIEVKTTFALLSQATAEPALAREAGLTEDELDSVRASVPWTRPFVAGPATDADGRRVDDLVGMVASDPDHFVLKRAWDYGGRAVFVGHSRTTPGFDERVRAAFGESLTWAELCRRCADDRRGGGFVVQRLVETKPEPHVLLTEHAQDETSLFVDFSAYASIGLDGPAWGGACRGSISHIVNIVGGGGVLPLVLREVAEMLYTAYRAHLPPR